MFRAQVLIVRRAKLYYTVSGIIIPIGTSQIQALWSLNTHNFNIIDVQLFLWLLLGCEFHLLNVIVVGMGLQ